MKQREAALNLHSIATSIIAIISSKVAIGAKGRVRLVAAIQFCSSFSLAPGDKDGNFSVRLGDVKFARDIRE